LLPLAVRVEQVAMRVRALLRPLLWYGKEVVSLLRQQLVLLQLSQLSQALSEVVLVPLRLERQLAVQDVLVLAETVLAGLEQLAQTER
jgi:hypothetical protein